MKKIILACMMIAFRANAAGTNLLDLKSPTETTSAATVDHSGNLLAVGSGTFRGDLQVGNGTASTFSASGYQTMAQLDGDPEAAKGRLYFNSAGALKVSLDGLAFVQVATGVAGGSGVASIKSGSNPALTGAVTLSSGSGISLLQESQNIAISVSSGVTFQGNTFNGANQIVQLNGSGELPAISGVNLTNVQHDPLLVGIDVKQNISSPENQGFISADSNIYFYYISIPPMPYYENETKITKTLFESYTSITAFISGTLKNLSCGSGQYLVGNSGKNTYYIVKINEADTTLACTASGPSGYAKCSSSNSVAVVPGDRISISVRADIGAGSHPNGTCLFQYAF